MSKVVKLTESAGIFSATSSESAAGSFEETLKLSYGVTAEFGPGLTFGRGRIEPGTTVPMHAADNAYALFVLSGVGVLTLFNPNGVECGREPVQTGDLVLFPPKAQHGWIVESGDPFEWFGVDIP